MSKAKNNETFVVHGLTDFRQNMTDSIKALMNDGKNVEVYAYGLDRRLKGKITLTYEKLETEDDID